MTDDFDPAMNGELYGAEEDATRAEAGEGAMTPMLEQAIRAARSLPEDDQDALAAAMLEWIEDQRRWAESFARTQEALVELAREALAEHHAGHALDLDAAYADMAADGPREAEAAEGTRCSDCRRR